MSAIATRYGAGLSEYFLSKLQAIAKEESDESLIRAEAERYREAEKVAQAVEFQLVTLLNLIPKTHEEQIQAVPYLEECPNRITLHSALFLSTLSYICARDEENDPHRANSYDTCEEKLPVYFKRRYQPQLLALFKEATQIVDSANFKPAAVANRLKDNLTSEVAINALRYACYVNEQPESKAFKCKPLCD
jgi:hypothetical protein